MENILAVLDITLLGLFLLISLFTFATAIGIILYTRNLVDNLEKVAFIALGIITLTLSILIIWCLVVIINNS